MVTLNLLSEVALIREPLTFEAGIYFVWIACILLTPIDKTLRIAGHKTPKKRLCSLELDVFSGFYWLH